MPTMARPILWLSPSTDYSTMVRARLIDIKKHVPMSILPSPAALLIVRPLSHHAAGLLWLLLLAILPLALATLTSAHGGGGVPGRLGLLLGRSALRGWLCWRLWSGLLLGCFCLACTVVNSGRIRKDSTWADAFLGGDWLVNWGGGVSCPHSCRL